MKKQTTAGKCLVPDCGKIVKCRGLCHSHYNYIASMVSGGAFTWDELVARGKALSTKGGGRGQVSQWLLDGNGQ